MDTVASLDETLQRTRQEKLILRLDPDNPKYYLAKLSETRVTLNDFIFNWMDLNAPKEINYLNIDDAIVEQDMKPIVKIHSLTIDLFLS